MCFTAFESLNCNYWRMIEYRPICKVNIDILGQKLLLENMIYNGGLT